ncbi:cryptochrome/photolyase family protein, partial [Enterococcus faecalis]|uniref:cryptochrome/photolyase family protein n=1 Tax=Enterococcus faecalis TaxID=1351 RepID=UPI003D6C4736
MEWQSADEWRLDAQLRAWAANQSLTTHEADTEHFMTGRHDLATMFAGRKQWLMERFYRDMRRRHHVLLDDNGNPEGGQWNF